jgi:hypothetical protein
VVVLDVGGSGLGVVAPDPYGTTGPKPGVMGIEDFVGLRGDSGRFSSVKPFRYVGLIRGFDISICRASLSDVLRDPPRKSFLVENLRDRLDPALVGVVAGKEIAGVASSGVGRG